MIVTTLCLLWYDDTTAFRYCKCGAAVGNRRRRVGNDSSDKSKSSANLRERLFQKRLEELYEYRKLYGHGSIPTPYPTNPSLGIWAANIRRQYTLYIVNNRTLPTLATSHLQGKDSYYWLGLISHHSPNDNSSQD